MSGHHERCKFLDCDRVVGPHGAKGYCSGHYQQLQAGKEFTPLKARNVLLPWLETHAAYEGDECLTWPFPLTSHGYGQIKYKGRMIGAHRLMCIMAHGQPPTPDHQAAHSCGRGKSGCVNPRHLRWATVVENAADKQLHGTQPKGEAIPWSILTADKVRGIREKVRTMSHAKVAALYGIKAKHVDKVAARLIWRHV